MLCKSGTFGPGIFFLSKYEHDLAILWCALYGACIVIRIGNIWMAKYLTAVAKEIILCFYLGQTCKSGTKQSLGPVIFFLNNNMNIV